MFVCLLTCLNDLNSATFIGLQFYVKLPKMDNLISMLIIAYKFIAYKMEKITSLYTWKIIKWRFTWIIYWQLSHMYRIV